MAVVNITDQAPLEGSSTVLLGDRLRVQIPHGAWIDGRHEGGIMGPEISTIREQRVGFDLGPMRLVTLAEDPLLLARPELPQLQQRLLEGVNRGHGVPWMVNPDAPPGSLILAAREAAPEREAIPLLVLWMQHPDGTLLRLSWFINAAAAQHWDGWLELAVAMALSAQPGPQILERTARAVRLDWCHAQVVELDLLPNFMLSADRGHDFVVHRLDELRALDSFAGSLGIYFGQHPSSHLYRMNPRPSAEELPATLLGQPMTWHHYPVEDLVKMEAIEPIHHARTLMHAFITGADAADCQRLASMVESIRKP